MKFFTNVSKIWYLNFYPDVRKARLNPKVHFLSHGYNEGRYANIFQFLNQGKSSTLEKVYNLIIQISFIFICKFKQKNIRLFFLRLIVALQAKKLIKYRLNSLLITSWLKDGVEEAIKLYIQLQSKDSKIALLKGIKDAEDTRSSPMTIEIWENNQLLYTTGILYPIETYNMLVRNHKYALNLHIHHTFKIELNVFEFLRLFTGKKYLYIHDYYIFTTNWHLFLENSTNKDLGYFNKFSPNKNINLEHLIRNIDLFICPSANVYFNCKPYIPESKLYWVYPPEKDNLESLNVNEIELKPKYKVLIIGNLGKNKGSAIASEVIEFCGKTHLPYEFIHFGREPIDNSFPNYVNYEGFTRQNMLDFCSTLDLDFAYLPFQAEETYSFTLSDVMMLELPLITSDVGAITERCARRNNSFLISRNSKMEDIINNFDLITKNRNMQIPGKISSDISLKRSRRKNLYLFLEK